MKIGEYEYVPHGSGYRIYMCDFNNGRFEMSGPVRGEPIYFNKEDARKRVYELNGWNYKPEDNGTKAQT